VAAPAAAARPPPEAGGAAAPPPAADQAADQVAAALLRIAAHISAPKKFAKASELLRSLLSQVGAPRPCDLKTK
jgi:hypothetical protein